MATTLKMAFFVIFLASFGIVSADNSHPSGLSLLQEDGKPPSNIISEAHSDARIRRDGWTGFSPLGLGTDVQFGDLIDPGGEPIRIVCADLREQVVTEIGPVPCSQERPILHQGEEALAGWQRSTPEDISMPFLIEPRATAVSSPSPVIMWNTVADVDSYRIVIRGENLEWSTDVNDPATAELTYPDDAPPLEPGVPYTVEVIGIVAGTEERSSTEEDVSGISFTVMDSSEYATTQALAAEVRNNVAEEDIANFIIARLHAQNGLYSEAIQTLLNITGDILDPDRPMETDLSKSPAVYLMLGDLFLQSQLELYATAAYAQALDLATASGDLESQARASVGLAQVVADSERRQAFLDNAIALYTELGAEEQLESIRSVFGIEQ